MMNTCLHLTLPSIAGRRRSSRPRRRSPPVLSARSGSACPSRSAPASTCSSRSPSGRASVRAARRSSPPASSAHPTAQRSSCAGFTSTAALAQIPSTRAGRVSRISSLHAPVRGRGPGPGATARLQPRPEGTRRSVGARRSLAERRHRPKLDRGSMVGGAKKSCTTSAAGNTQQPISARTDQQNGLPHDPLNAAQSQGSNHPTVPNSPIRSQPARRALALFFWLQRVA